MRTVKKWLTPIAGLLVVAMTFGILAPLIDSPLGLMVAIGTAVTTRSLTEIIGEMKKLRDEYKGKPMPTEIGEKYDALGAEALELQKSLERERQLLGLEDFDETTRTVDSPILPAGAGAKQRENEIAGYLTLGEAVVTSQLYKQFAEANFPKGTFPLLVVEQLRNVKGSREAYVPLTRKQRAEWEEKAVPTLGAGVIEPQRLADISQVVANDETVLRDVLNVSRTNSSAVEYVRRESYTRAAAPVAHGAAKPQGASEYTLQTASVRTIAVWIPATVQMLSDWPALRNLIDNDLLYDLRKEEEEQVMYGDGTGQNFAGIVPNAGHDINVSDARVTSPTLVDQILVGATDVRVAGYMPNAVVMHPFDREKLALQKGSDGHYLYQTFPTQDGVDRVWSLRIVQSIAAEENAGNPTEERNIVVGDFRRGATLWIREEAQVLVGMQNDDFTKNLRTILAEERAAFAVRAPDAFAVLTTQASAT